MTQRAGAIGTDITSTLSGAARQVQNVAGPIQLSGVGSFSARASQVISLRATFAGTGSLSGLAHGTFYYIRPDADDSDGTWTTEAGGTNLFPSIDETSVNDADYIQSAATPVADVCRFRLSDPPAGTVLAVGFKVRIRYKKSGADRIALTVRLKQGVTQIASWVHNDITAAFVTVEDTLTAPQFAAITDFNDLFVELQADEGYDAATAAWAAAVVTNGGTVSDARKLVVDDLVTGLKTDGVWTKLDRLWLFAAENTQSALTDVVGLTLAAEGNSPTFTVDTGYAGTGGGGAPYIDSNFNPTTGSPLFVQDSASAFVWPLVPTVTSNAVMGQNDPSRTMELYPRYTGDITFWRVNTTTDDSGTSTDGSGLFHATRTASNAQTLYKNGLSVDSNTIASTSMFNMEFDFLRGAFGGSVNTVACGGFGGGMNAVEAAALYTRLHTYMLTVGVGYDTATTAWAAAVVTNGGTVSDARKLVVDNLITSLKADGIWTKLDRLWLLAAENEASALTDLVADSLATKVSTPTFTTDRGYTGEDSLTPTKYIDTNYNPFTQGVTYTTNDAHVSTWSATNTASTLGGGLMGNANADGTSIWATYADGNVYARVNDIAGSQGAPGTRQGSWIVTRDSSTTDQLYQNGSLFSSPNATVSTFSNTKIAITAAALGLHGTPNQIAMASAGGKLNSTEAGNFYTHLRTYMTSVGVP